MTDNKQSKRNIVGSGMTCCFAVPEQWHEDRIRLDAEEAHHLGRVLRMKSGDAVRVLDGQGRCADGTLEFHGKSTAAVVVGNIQSQPPITPRIILLQAMIKNSRMEWLVQKAVELGVSRIIPVQTERSVVKIKASAEEARRQRLLSVAVSAQKQCSILWLPEIVCPVSFNDAVNDLNDSTLMLYGALEVESMPLRDCLRSQEAVPEQVAVVVGPEGDFSPVEYEVLRQAGAQPVSLGNNILRSETASLHMISALRYEYATV